MVDEERRNLRPWVEDRQLGQSCDGGQIAATSIDPRIVSIARAIGRLIARERFKQLTSAHRPKD
jgi:hypothetical protein